MSDKLSKILQEHGFSFVKLPRPIQLLDLFVLDHGVLSKVGSINDLFVKKEEKLPENTMNQSVPSEIGGLIDKKVDMKLSMSLLKGFLPKAIGLETAFDAATKISFSFNNAKLDSTSLIQLDTFINDAGVNDKAKTFQEKLMDSDMFIVTEVLKSKSFSVEALNSSGGSLDLDGPEVEKIVEANAKLNRTSGNNTKITYSGDDELAIGIKAAQIHNNKSWKFWKDLSFSLKSGETRVVRGRSATQKVHFLSEKFIQIEG